MIILTLTFIAKLLLSLKYMISLALKEALSGCCDQDVDNCAKFFHVLLSSRVSGPSDSPILEDNPETQRRARDFAGPHA